MRIDIISAVPELFESFLQNSIPARAVKKGVAEINIISLRDFGLGSYKQIDDYAYGGGAGMVLMPEPLSNCIENLTSKTQYDDIIYMTPDGQTMNQSLVNHLSLSNNMIFICGHYKGIDHRIRELYVTKEISLGDFVLSGGEIAAAALTDAIVRLLPGAIGDEESALTDSFQDHLLAPPIYTRPIEFRGKAVPEILLGGNHKLIEEWKFEKAIERTQLLRPDLLKKFDSQEKNKNE